MYLYNKVECLLCQDHFLRGQKLPGSSVRMRQRLFRLPRLSEPVQLHPCGERSLGGVREAQLHGLPVRPDPGRVSGLPTLDGSQ